jgi:hypothetical protein
MDDKKVKWTLNMIKALIEEQIGDPARLESIQKALEGNREVYDSDKNYLKEKFSQLQKIKPGLDIDKEISQEAKTTGDLEKPDKEHDEHKPENIQEAKIRPADTKEQPSSEIEELRKEIQKLQDKNTLIERHLTNPYSGSMLRAFGRGTGGVALFLFGLGMVFGLYYYFDNIDSSMRGMYYGGDPGLIILYAFVIVPGIFLGIGGASIYYAIRIISRT